jgi:L-cysteine:1D-myo-inositol 2-amino-2-deoxy-alpha-D-glucopyranoside ligase
MRLFDTATRAYVNVQPKQEMRVYVCGITPYDSAHVGHAFTFLTYDLLQRRLESRGSRVRLVRNITDVDEPIYAKARELSVHYLDLATQETAAFQAMMRALNLKDPAVEPKPSEHIEEIVSSVKELVDRGFAYTLDGDIYFGVAQFPKFGQVSGYSTRLMTAFSKERGGDPERPGKRHPLDFLLWRAITDNTDPAAWDTVVGYGRPGWHIECTAMSFSHLGSTIDIHGGGTDLIFPHHDCETAQSTALGREPFVRQWVHTASMLLGGEKMSKSLGNLVFVRDLVERVDPAAVRIALMTYHYRTGGEWRDDVLHDAARLLGKINQALTQPSGADARPFMARVEAALDNDLDAPEAIRAVQDMTQSLLVGGSDERAAEGLRDMLTLLGIEPLVASSRGTP